MKSAETPATDVRRHLGFRDAKGEEEGTLADLVLRSFVEREARTSMERIHELADLRALMSSGAIRVLELEREPIGLFALLDPGAPSSEAWLPDAANLRSVAILPELQGKGLGSILLDEARRCAIARGWTRICIHVRNDSDSLQGFYLRQGFESDPAGDMACNGIAYDGFVTDLRQDGG